jgi:hypothetical protein
MQELPACAGCGHHAGQLGRPQVTWWNCGIGRGGRLGLGLGVRELGLGVGVGLRLGLQGLGLGLGVRG